MTLPTTQSCDDVVITTASKTTQSAADNNGNHSSTTISCNNTASATAAPGDVQLMDLMLTATPSPADDNNNEIASSGGDTGSPTPTRDEDSLSPVRSRTFEDDDSDMFGPPRSAPLLNSNRPRVPMISAKLRMREERKRILQLCANKLEKIKDSETNLRRSVCINNTYSRLTEEVRREKQSRYLANLPKCDSRTNSNINQTESATPELRRCCRLTIPNQPATACFNELCCAEAKEKEQRVPPLHGEHLDQPFKDHVNRPPTPAAPIRPQRRRSQVDTDLESIDREIAAMNASIPPVDPEITQGAEQLEKAIVSRKRTRMEACFESDRFFALSQIYLPSPRLLTGIDDPPCVMDGLMKRPRLMGPGMSFDSALMDFDLEIMETLRFGPTMVSGGGAMAGGNNAVQGTNAAATADSCGHAAMLSEQCNGGGFHGLVVASLET